MTKEKNIETTGVISEILGNNNFRVLLDTGQTILAYASGKMNKFHISMILGDSVKVELSPYDLTRGRIVYRSK